MAFGLENETIMRIQEVFGEFPEVSEVVLYGSRAMGNFQPGSDIDITIKTTRPNLDMLNSISMQLDNLMLPYLFDLSFYSHIQNKDLLTHIGRVGKVLYQKVN